LDEVAEKVTPLSFPFQRIFTEWAGISPKRFLQFSHVDFLKNKLGETKNLIDAAAACRTSSQSRVYDLFTSLEAVTPQSTNCAARVSISTTVFMRPFSGLR